MGRPYKTWPVAFLDIETTGLDSVHHEILEIAIVRTDRSPFVSKVRPVNLHTASAKALQVNGYNDAEWEGAPVWGDVAQRVHDHLSGCAIVGHNVQFDLKFLLWRLDALDLLITTRPRIMIDTMAMAFAQLVPRGLTKLSLVGCCEFLGIPPEDKRHRAFAGAMACKRVYEAINNTAPEPALSPQEQA